MAVAEKPSVRFPSLAWGQPVVRRQWQNERCIEIPLAQSLMQFWQPGTILDAGCALNGVYESAPLATLTHLTQNLAKEDRHLQANRVYAEGDLRDLSRYADRAFDRIACISTLEHVGCDNTVYGGPVEDDPHTVVKAAQELWRVCGDRLFVTVPFRMTAHREVGWRSFTPDTLRMDLLTYWPGADVAYYVRTGDGWSGPWGYPESDDPAQTTAHKVNQIACVLVTR